MGKSCPCRKTAGIPGHPTLVLPGWPDCFACLGTCPTTTPSRPRAHKPTILTLLRAVRRYQERHGLPETGYLDAGTIEQLNVPLRHRLEQIRLAMERYRWLRRDFRQAVILINIPGFHLYAFNEERKIALTMRVDVGEDFDRTRTPVIEDSIEYLVFRPYWSVPFDIQRDEVIPILVADPNYLKKYHFDFFTPSGQLVSARKVTKDLLRELHAGSLRMRQRPGPENPMGLVKFVFPNRYSIYLHDFPLRDINFILPQRVASHGCIHLEKPAELAAWVLRDKPAWNLERVRQAMEDGQDNRRVNLSKPLAVLILYTTVSTWQHGHIYFYRDIYGYDADLEQALAKGYPYPKRHEGERSKLVR